jgi:hypothetical protein
MNVRLSKRNFVRAAKGILGCGALASLALASGGTLWGQSQTAQPPSTTVRPSVAALGTSPGVPSQDVNPTPKLGTTRDAHAKASAKSGRSEGITVSGRWTIEVRNPDGKLVSRREFENSLAPNNIWNTVGGAGLLAGLLASGITPGSWMVVFSDTAGDGTSLTNIIGTVQPNSVAAQQNFCPTPTTCSTNLSVTSGSLATNPGILTFSGSTIVPPGYPSQIGWVATVAIPCQTSESPETCYDQFVGSVAGPIPFTALALDGNTTAGAAAGDPNPVAVTPGQTVEVTVVISFSSAGATSTSGASVPKTPAFRH